MIRLLLLTISAMAVIVMAVMIWRMTKRKGSISFFETFNLTDIPIITFMSGGNRLNFLLDTGSTQSHIASSAMPLVKGDVKAEGGVDIISEQGKARRSCLVMDAVLSYKGSDYEAELLVNDSLDASFDALKKSKGVRLHGILGSDFLDRHSYVLDFKRYIAYSN